MPPEATATTTEVPPEVTATEGPGEPTETPIPGANIMDILWQWVSLQESRPAGQSIIADPEDYDLVLKPDLSFDAKADCVGAAGTYTITATEIVFEIGPYAAIQCPEGSLSDAYIQFLGQVNAWALINEQLFLGYGEGAGILGYQNAGAPPEQ